MRDDEPVGRGAGPAPTRSRATGRLLVPLVVVGAAVVVLSTAVAGPVRFTSPFGAGAGTPSGASPPPGPTAAPRPSLGPIAPAAGAVVQDVLVVLACAVALVVAVVLIRLVVAAVRGRRRRPGRRGAPGTLVSAEPEVADAPTVLRGIAAALQTLDQDREAGDAVVRAWLGLQQAAEDAGVARSPAETPTEFTGRVLARTGADRVALRTLLGLYLRARFGDGPIAADDARTARDSLRALEASWERGPA